MNRLLTVARTTLIAVLVLAGVAFALSPSSSSAQVAAAFEEGDEVIVIDGELNLREEPGLDAEVVTVLPDAAPLSILDGPETADDINWYQVITDDVVVGWVASDFIADAPVEPAFAAGDTIIIANGPLNLRAEPGLETEILATLDQGVEADIVADPVLADEFFWYQVNVPGGEMGWLAEDFLALVPSDPVDEVEQFVFVETDLLNLRTEPSLEAEVATTLNNGTVAVLLDGAETADEIDWVQIAAGEGDDTVEGWVAGEFLSEPISVGEDAEVVDGPLNLRGSTALDAEILQTLETGDVVSVTGGPFTDDEFAWFEVQVDGQTGFVAGVFLGPVGADNAEVS